MNKKYCPIHDRMINNLMDKYKFTYNDRFTAKLGYKEIWISNYPYSVGIYGLSHISRPSRLTILIMREKLLTDLAYES
jgi:hypothetical protein